MQRPGLNPRFLFSSYGEYGYEVMLTTLEQLYSDWTPRPEDGLEKSFFLRRVLLPEATVQLIIQDQDCPRDRAVEIMEHSRAYGQAAHSPCDELLLSQKDRREAEAEADRLAGGSQPSSNSTRYLRSHDLT